MCFIINLTNVEKLPKIIKLGDSTKISILKALSRKAVPLMFPSFFILKTHLAKKRMAIKGKIRPLKMVSEKAKLMTKGDVTWTRTGLWLSIAKMVTILNKRPVMEMRVAEPPPKRASKGLKTNWISWPSSAMQTELFFMMNWWMLSVFLQEIDGGSQVHWRFHAALSGPRTSCLFQHFVCRNYTSHCWFMPGRDISIRYIFSSMLPPLSTVFPEFLKKRPRMQKSAKNPKKRQSAI